MKLNYKRTLLVGMAFFLITAFWQAYDAIIPLILTNHYGLPQSASGAVMSLDNVLAVFMLPLFGSISDKVHTKWGKRTPFIFFGTIAAVLCFVLLTFLDNYQLAKVIEAGIPELTQGGMSDAAFAEHTRKLAFEITVANPLPFVGFIATLLVTLIAMATFRSPAVALMPDVTIKPLRSKGNAIINLMGTAGGIIVLVLGIVFATGSVENSMMNYTLYYGVIAALMLGALAVFRFTVKEKEWSAEMQQQTKALGIEEQEPKQTVNRKLSKDEQKSLLLILASIALWYIGYNAITSKYSLYASRVLDMDYNTTLLLAQAAAIISYLPAGMVASKIGRKKTILSGVVMLTSAFAIASFLRSGSSVLLMNVLFCLAGIGWATINVNSFPMVVELSRGGDVGKYTGFYYTASMAAQTFTPYFSGALMDKVGMTALFPYATVFVVLAAFTMAFVKHGDSKPIPAKSKLEALDVGD